MTARSESISDLARRHQAAERALEIARRSGAPAAKLAELEGWAAHWQRELETAQRLHAEAHPGEVALKPRRGPALFQQQALLQEVPAVAVEHFRDTRPRCPLCKRDHLTPKLMARPSGGFMCERHPTLELV